MLELHAIDLSNNSNYKYNLKLTLPNKKVISDISLEYVTSTDLKFNDTSSVSLRIPKYITTEKGVLVENRLYGLCTSDKLITLNEEFCFYIKDYQEEENGEKDCVKTLTCYSRDKKLEKRFFDFNEGMTRQIKSDDVNASEGVLDFFVEDTYYTIDYIDDDAKYEHINGGTSAKYRWFDSGSSTWLNNIRDTFQRAYKCLFLLNSYNKSVSVYDQNNIGKHQGLYLSFDNFVQKINKKTNNEPIVTRLNVDAGGNQDTVDISTVNPTGKSYIERFDCYYDIMSVELKNALIKYNDIVEEKYIEWLEIKNEISDLNSQVNTINANLTALGEALKPQKEARIIYIRDKQNDLLSATTTEIERLEGLINQNVSNKASLMNQIEAKNELISNIASQLEKKTCKDENNNLVFSTELLSELSEYIYEASYSNEYFLTSQGLFDDANEQLIELQKPPIEFDMDAISFIDIIKHPKGWNKILRLGDFVTVDSKNFGKIECRLIGIQHVPQKGDSKPTLKLTFSNKPYKFEELNIGNSVSRGVKASNNLNSNGKKWNDYQVGVDFAKDVLQNGLNLSAQMVQNRYGNQNRIWIDEGGILIQSVQEPDSMLYLGSGLLAISDDGFLTSKTALDKNGLLTESLVGKWVISETNYISDNTGLFTIKGSSLTVRDANNRLRVFLGVEDGEAKLELWDSTGLKTILSDEGILQSDTYTFHDNVSNNIGDELKVKFYIPDNARSIYQVKLALTLEEFRSYSSTSAGGGAYVSSVTSSAGGATTQTSSAGGSYSTTQTSSFGSYVDGDDIINGEYVDTSTPWVTGDTLQEQFDGHTHLSLIKAFNHSHSVSINIGSHSHSTSIPNHQHLTEISLPNHQHSIIPAIYKSTRSSNVRITIDGTQLPMTIIGDSYLDLTSYMSSGTGWKNLSISSETLGRIGATLFIQYFASV